MLYQMIYALAARDGREEALFGESAPLACKAFAQSLAGEEFPELWFEVPLAGEPWFDLHALASREGLSPDDVFTPERTGQNPDAFAWFAAQRDGVRQLALSWDTGRGETEHPAVQLLVYKDCPELTCGFLEAAGRPDAMGAYRSCVNKPPKGWFACYAGVFPQRPGHNLRVECIPSIDLQRAYAKDPALLEAHLRQVGIGELAASADEASGPAASPSSSSSQAANTRMPSALGDTLLPRCQLMAKTPFRLEFQFDVDSNGRAGQTFGASLRFAKPPREGSWEAFLPDGPAGEFMREVEAWGLADGRWRKLAETTFAKRVSHGDESHMLFCYPAFIKLRWRAGEPVDAKAYIIAGAQ